MNPDSLRSPHVKTGGIVYFARMLDKIRLHAAGALDPDWVRNLGTGFDGRCVNFLHIDYAALVERVIQGGEDPEILQWAFEKGRKPSEEEIEIWNDFMSKRGWKDAATPILEKRLLEGGFSERKNIETMFDFIDLDEGRDPRSRPAL